MTGEEAIRCLNVHSSTNGSGLCTDKQHYEAKQMGIEALQQQSCGDVISKQAVLELVADYDLSMVQAAKGIYVLPPVTSQQKWIPCSERLPAEDGFYLATCNGEICGESEPFSGLAEFQNGKWVDDEEDYQCVVAWMPLPTPYEPQERRCEE